MTSEPVCQYGIAPFRLLSIAIYLQVINISHIMEHESENHLWLYTAKKHNLLFSHSQMRPPVEVVHCSLLRFYGKRD